MKIVCSVGVIVQIVVWSVASGVIIGVASTVSLH